MAAGNLVQGALFTVMVVRAGLLRAPEFEHELTRQIERSPRFFRNAPVVLDLRDAEEFGDFDEARQLLRRHTLTLVGVQNALPAQLDAATALGLASFAPTAALPSSRRAAADVAAAVGEGSEAAAKTTTAQPQPSQPQPSQPQPPPGAAALPAAAASKARLVTQPVRSGTQIYARGCDLVVTAAVSPGAELIADGNIHVYGTLRGRALAGASGDSQARIFCSRLDAELVSIAGRYLVSEQLPADQRSFPVQIALDDDRLTVTRL